MRVEPRVITLDDNRFDVEFDGTSLGRQYNWLTGMQITNWQRIDGNCVRVIFDNSQKA
jgi:hypothetical protein